MIPSPDSTPTWLDSRPSDWTPEWCPAPQWGTRRRPERQTLGPAVAEVAEFLGTPFHPSQQVVMDTAMELDPDTNTLVYSTVIILIHRQWGKSSLTLPRWVFRARRWRDQDMIYTAQRGKWATKKFKTDFVRKLRSSPLVESPVRATRIVDGAHYRVLMGSGMEGIEFPNGSTITVSAPGEDSGHGTTLDEAVVDEAFVHETADVDSGFGVPMITRGRRARASRGALTPGPQLWIISAAGHERSTYLIQKRDAGRASVERDDDRGIAYFEWSCPPAWDITDRSLWWHYIPALGHLIDEEDVATELKNLDEDEWRRAYATQFHDRVHREESPINVEEWGRLVDKQARHEGRLVYGVDVAPSRDRATVGVAGARVGGGYLVEQIEARLGTRWVPEFLREVIARNGGAGVAVDPGSAAGALIPDLEAMGLEVIQMTARQHAQACGALVDRVPTGELFHLGQPALDDAVAGAKKRTLGDAWAWDRRQPDADITPLVAVTLAFGALLSLPPEEEDGSLSVYSERGFVEW